jgi:hypothetical protein
VAHLIRLLVARADGRPIKIRARTDVDREPRMTVLHQLGESVGHDRADGRWVLSVVIGQTRAARELASVGRLERECTCAEGNQLQSVGISCEQRASRA